MIVYQRVQLPFGLGTTLQLVALATILKIQYNLLFHGFVCTSEQVTVQSGHYLTQTLLTAQHNDQNTFMPDHESKSPCA